MTETFYDGKSMEKFLNILYDNYLLSIHDRENVPQVRVRIGKSMAQKWYMVIFEPVVYCNDTKFWDNIKVCCIE